MPDEIGGAAVVHGTHGTLVVQCTMYYMCTTTFFWYTWYTHGTYVLCTTYVLKKIKMLVLAPKHMAGMYH